MKKTICALLIVVLALSVVFAGCGTPEAIDTTAADTTGALESTEAVIETTEAYVETTEAAGPLTEGTVVLADLVSVDLVDGWYSEEGVDTTWNSIELINDSIGIFMANVEVEVSNIYTAGEGAEYWANAINDNYGGGGTITTEEINGVSYYHLSNVTDDDTQNFFFVDLDDSHYLQVSVMFMPLENGMPAFDLITILN